ncbi:MAG: hypothetical protein LIP01_11625 [Tannerellaceae bacterium]|nr:hypothetical protein [Tannerellaceae bacterium]
MLELFSFYPLVFVFSEYVYRSPYYYHTPLWFVLLLFLCLLFFWFWEKYKNLQKERIRQKQITHLVMYGKRIQVDLSACCIGKIEFETPGYYYWWRGYKEPKKISYCFLTYTLFLEGKSFCFKSDLIEKSEETIAMWLRLRGETTLCIDPEDESNYYLDVEFMERD